jgi:hypothetical protein
MIDLGRSNEIRLEEWSRRPLHTKLGQRAAGLAEAWL